MAHRILIWLIALMLAIGSTVAATGAITKSKAPEQALLFWPKNGFAVEELAGRFAKTEIARNNASFPEDILPGRYDLGEQAFLSEPITPVAVAVMALTKKGRKREKLMAKAYDLSRREPVIMGWLITDGVSRNDVSSVLQSYDTMLRTTSSSGPIIFPVMAKALANEGAVEAFSEILQPSPSWASGFWLEVVKTPEAVDNAGELRNVLFKKGDQGSPYRDADLIAALVRQQKFEKAEALFALFSSRNKNEEIVHNADFALDSKYPPIDWQLYSTGEFGAEIAADRMQLSAVPNSGGLFARQILKLPKSLLTLNVVMSQTIPNGTRLTLELSCVEDIEDRPQRIKILMPGGTITQKINNANSPCEYYWMDLVGRSSTNGDGFDVTIDSISLLPG